MSGEDGDSQNGTLSYLALMANSRWGVHENVLGFPPLLEEKLYRHRVFLLQTSHDLTHACAFRY